MGFQSTGNPEIDRISAALTLKEKWVEVGDKAVDTSPAEVQETLSAFMLPLVMQVGALLGGGEERGVVPEADRDEWEANINKEIRGAVTATFAYTIWLSEQDR